MKENRNKAMGALVPVRRLRLVEASKEEWVLAEYREG